MLIAIAAITILLPQYFAVNQPLSKADVLVVESWTDDEQLKKSIDIFINSDYQFLITTGTKLSTGKYLSKYDN